MKTNLRDGAIFLPLLLVLSLSGFVLVKAVASKSIEDYQAGVDVALSDRFNTESGRYSLANFIGEPATWTIYSNATYGYQFAHPTTWQEVKSPNYLNSGLPQYIVSFSDKATLRSKVVKNFDILGNAKKIKIKDIVFYIYEDTPNLKAAVVDRNKLYYIIELENQNFFSGETQFRGAFYQILKTFKFKA